MERGGGLICKITFVFNYSSNDDKMHKETHGDYVFPRNRNLIRRNVDDNIGWLMTGMEVSMNQKTSQLSKELMMMLG